MTSMTSIKIATNVKDRLSHLKVHPRETYSELIERLTSQTLVNLTPIYIPLLYARIQGVIREFSHPVDISIEIDDGDIIMYNHEYGLLVVTNNITEGINDIIDELEENWVDYTQSDEKSLVGPALELKKKYVQLFS